MKLVDVHAHLDHLLFKKDLDEVVKRAKESGVVAIISSGVNHPSNLRVMEISEKYGIVKWSFGMYPIDLLGLGVDETGIERQTTPIDLNSEFEFIKKNRDEIVSIGEVGLDYHWDKEHHAKQKESFQRIIDFAEKIKKPVLIHSRKAEADVFQMLESSRLKKNKIVLHCFEARKHILKKAVENNYRFTIPCTVIKLQHFQNLVQMANISQLLTETDCPWLSPYPDKRNEPAFVIGSVKKIAELKQLDVEETANNILKNYFDIFGTV